jgi:hypothetical protein
MSEMVLVLASHFPLPLFTQSADFFPGLMKSTTSLLEAIGKCY